MRITYILMQFPAPRETFVTTELLATSKYVDQIYVHSLRRKHANHKKLLNERKIGNIYNTSADLKNLFSGLISIILNFRLSLALVFKLASRAGTIENFIKSILLLPRAFNICNLIEKHGTDILQLYWGHYPAILSYIVRRKMPQVVISHGFVAYDLALNFPFAYDQAKDADLITTITNYDVNSLKEKINRDDIMVFYHGLLSSFLKSNNSLKEVNSLITVGALIESKAPIDNLKVFKSLKSKWENCKLSVLGDGSMRKKVENYIKNNSLENVSLKGHVSHQEVFTQLEKAEIFLFMSKHNERIPNVVKEAMISGCICIVSNTPAIEEIIDHGENGFIVEQGDVENAYLIIDKIFSGVYDKEKLRAKAIKKVKEEFNAEIIAQKKVMQLTSLIDNKRKILNV